MLLPEVIWRIFVTWYGNTGYSPLALPRTVGIITSCLFSSEHASQCGIFFRFVRMEKLSFIQSRSRFIVTQLCPLQQSSHTFLGPSQPSSVAWDSWDHRLHSHLPRPPCWVRGRGGQLLMGDSLSYQDECTITKLLLTNQPL